ncbi:MAG: hypothetical protein ACLUDY_20955 [Bacteroides xylanisolvens]
MKQKLLTDIELDVHELKYLMDSFTKEPTPTLSELLKREHIHGCRGVLGTAIAVKIECCARSRKLAPSLLF